jgi:ABC-type transport system involved in multi-copper enzyme maturation permease subunit
MDTVHNVTTITKEEIDYVLYSFSLLILFIIVFLGVMVFVTHDNDDE